VSDAFESVGSRIGRANKSQPRLTEFLHRLLRVEAEDGIRKSTRVQHVAQGLQVRVGHTQQQVRMLIVVHRV
jgi:hypothetical protein